MAVPQTHIHAPTELRQFGYHAGHMLLIEINWEFFLGILGTLIALAYYANGRLTKLETSVEWLRSAIETLMQAGDNALRVGRKRIQRLRKKAPIGRRL